MQEPRATRAHNGNYYGKVNKEGLEALFGRDVDLLTGVALQNPYLRREVEAHRQTLFTAE